MLTLNSISSVDVDLKKWHPSTEEVFICLDLEIGFSDKDDGTNLFYVTLATPEALRKNAEGFLLADNRTLVISEYSYRDLLVEINKILKRCSKKNWEQSCEFLQRYFQWEYEDYVADNLH